MSQQERHQENFEGPQNMCLNAHKLYQKKKKLTQYQFPKATCWQMNHTEEKSNIYTPYKPTTQ
jgi:hypothetical protein